MGAAKLKVKAKAKAKAKASAGEKGAPSEKAFNAEENAGLQNDVATFAKSIGLSAPGAPSHSEGGFDDRDFRKKGPIANSTGPGKKHSGNENPKEGEAAKKGNRKSKDDGGGEASRSGADRKGFGEEHEKSVSEAGVHRRWGGPLASGAAGPPGGYGESSRWRREQESHRDGPKPQRRSPPLEEHADDLFLKPPKSAILESLSRTKLSKILDWQGHVASRGASLLEGPVRWYDVAQELSSSLQPPPSSGPQNPNSAAPAPQDLEKHRSDGEALLVAAASTYEQRRQADSDARWLDTVRRSGTTADRVAALTVGVQEDPISNLRSLDALLSLMLGKGGKRHAAVAVEALTELFVTTLLPSRKLRRLQQQPLHLLPQSEGALLESAGAAQLLLLWRWEECLKERYERFVVGVEALAKDPLEFLRDKGVKALFTMLKEKPEQEQRLLSALVNKLGDPLKKVASKASFLLGRLLEAHPAMSRIVVAEVDSFVFRPGVGTRAQHYAAVFLNQIVLSRRPGDGNGPLLAKALVELYFGLFRALTATQTNTEEESKFKSKGARGGKGLHENRSQGGRGKGAKGKGKWGNREEEGMANEEHAESALLSALLTGVNRAFPFVAGEDVEALVEQHTPELFRMAHSPNFNLGVQALALLQNLLSRHNALSARFYRALYSVLLSPALAKSSKAPMFLALVYRSLKADVDVARVSAFVKRLFQVALQQPAPWTCGVLVLVSELLKQKPVLWESVKESEGAKDDDVEHFMDLDVDVEETMAADAGDAGGADNGTEELRSSAHHMNGVGESTFVGDGIGVRKGAKGAKGPWAPVGNGDLAGEEVGEGVAGADRGAVGGDAVGSGDAQPAASRSPAGSRDDRARKDKRYSMNARDPSLACADTACWWELEALAAHFHPTVAAMASSLLFGMPIVFGGDPLRDMTLGAFLDRFAEKKPKRGLGKTEREAARGASLMQPWVKGLSMHASLALTGRELASLEESSVAAQDVFFHRFYKAAEQKRQEKAQRTGKGGADEEREEEEDEVEEEGHVDDEQWAQGDGGDSLDDEGGEEESEGEKGVGLHCDDGSPGVGNVNEQEEEDDQDDDRSEGREHSEEGDGEGSKLSSDDEWAEEGDDEEDEELDLFLEKELEREFGMGMGGDADDLSREKDEEEYDYDSLGSILAGGEDAISEGAVMEEAIPAASGPRAEGGPIDQRKKRKKEKVEKSGDEPAGTDRRKEQKQRREEEHDDVDGGALVLDDYDYDAQEDDDKVRFLDFGDEEDDEEADVPARELKTKIRREGKGRTRKGKSPFANAEDYAHLFS